MSCISDAKDKILAVEEMNAKIFSEISVFFRTILSTYDNLRANIEIYKNNGHS